MDRKYKISPSSSLSLVYDLFYREQEKSGFPLTREKASRILQTTPGLSFESGTTLDYIFNTLESMQWISQLDQRWIYVKNIEHAQSQPKCTEKSLDTIKST